MKRIAFAVWLLVAAAAPLAAQGKDTRHPIERWVDENMEKPQYQSTAGMIQLADLAYQKWDQELNRVYGQVMARLRPEEQAALREAQRAWLKYRDAEFAFLEKVYGRLEGTMYLPMHAFDRADVVAGRVKDLTGHHNLLGME